MSGKNSQTIFNIIIYYINIYFACFHKKGWILLQDDSINHCGFFQSYNQVTFDSTNFVSNTKNIYNNKIVMFLFPDGRQRRSAGASQ